MNIRPSNQVNTLTCGLRKQARCDLVAKGTSPAFATKVTSVAKHQGENMKANNADTPRQQAPANGSKDGSKEKASNTAGNAKPSSTRSAKQGEKKTTGGK